MANQFILSPDPPAIRHTPRRVTKFKNPYARKYPHRRPHMDDPQPDAKLSAVLQRLPGYPQIQFTTGLRNGERWQGTIPLLYLRAGT